LNIAARRPLVEAYYIIIILMSSGKTPRVISIELRFARSIFLLFRITVTSITNINVYCFVVPSCSILMLFSKTRGESMLEAMDANQQNICRSACHFNLLIAFFSTKLISSQAISMLQIGHRSLSTILEILNKNPNLQHEKVHIPLQRCLRFELCMHVYTYGPCSQSCG